MNKTAVTTWLLFCGIVFAAGSDAPLLLADRTAIERVYHEHRTGSKPPFEQAMPRELLEKLVRQDQHKEAVLKKVYGVEVTPAMVAAEMQRIHTTTRAPEMLAEIKAALGDDAERFARSMVRPIVVERILRSRFDNDDALHAAQRHAAEQAREALIAKKPVEAMHEVTWQLTPRPADGKPDAPAVLPATPSKDTAASASYSVEATVQIAQVLAFPDHGPQEKEKEKFYFEDLDPQLQNVLRVQLQKPGDVSAVIETASGFLVFQARARTETLTAISLSLPKRSYEEWLAQQREP